jgi:hypothetical protein
MDPPCVETKAPETLVKYCQEQKVDNCDIFMKQKILVINGTKQDKILLKPKVYDRENLHGIP